MPFFPMDDPLSWAIALSRFPLKPYEELTTPSLPQPVQQPLQLVHQAEQRPPTCAHLGSITLNEREAWFSQPKRELYRLMRALQASGYWLLGFRKLIVEMDAKYLKGMLTNPGIGPNATIMQWVEEVLIYYFTLCHVPGKTLSMDGLSRRVKQHGDEEYEEVNSDFQDYGI